MTCRYRVAKKEERDSIADRIVDLETCCDGIYVVVNGVKVAAFLHGCNHLEVFSAVPTLTGLKADKRGNLFTQ